MPIFTLLCAKSLQSCPTLCDPMDCSQQALLSMKFSRQEYWHALPCSPPGDLPNPGIKPTSLISPALAGGFFTTSVIWEALIADITSYYEFYFLCSPTSILLISYLHGIIFQSFIFFLTCVYAWSPFLENNILMYTSSVQFSSVAQLCLILRDPMNHSMPGLPVHQQLLEFTQTHVHWVSDAIQPSHSLLSPSPPAFNLSQHQGLFQWVSPSHHMAKVLEFQLPHQSFQWTPRTDLL